MQTPKVTPIVHVGASPYAPAKLTPLPPADPQTGATLPPYPKDAP